MAYLDITKILTTSDGVLNTFCSKTPSTDYPTYITNGYKTLIQLQSEFNFGSEMFNINEYFDCQNRAFINGHYNNEIIFKFPSGHYLTLYIDNLSGNSNGNIRLYNAQGTLLYTNSINLYGGATSYAEFWYFFIISRRSDNRLYWCTYGVFKHTSSLYPNQCYSTGYLLPEDFSLNFEGTENPYITAPESTPDGGFGDFDYKSDTVPLPTTPTISVSDSGFVTLYKPSLAQLQALSAYMWSGLFDITTFRKIFADPMDCIISLSLIPVNPTATGSQELKVGNVGTGLTFDKLPTQFIEVNFNSINIGRRANNFMDYSPYTKVQIYLPFIGTRSLSIDDIAGKNVSLKYIIDIFTGACNASIGVEVEDRDGTQKTTCLYQFTGNVLANIPVTASNFASFLQATVGAVSTAIGVATGAGALAGVASAINASQSMKPDIEKSGNLSATAGFLGVQKPYLLLTYPNLCRPEGRDKVTGTPSFLGLSSNKKLSSFHGYTQLHRVNVRGITCTETERQMILSQLTGEGVILP